MAGSAADLPSGSVHMWADDACTFAAGIQGVDSMAVAWCAAPCVPLPVTWCVTPCVAWCATWWVTQNHRLRII